MRVFICALECIRTKLGERTEELKLYVTVNGHQEACLCPFTMSDGDVKEIQEGVFDGYRIKINLMEWDLNAEECLGGVEFHRSVWSNIWDRTGRRPPPGLNEPGPYAIDCPSPSDEGYGRYDRHYRIYCYVKIEEEGGMPPEPFLLELISLTCNNAQEYKDYVYINVDGNRVFGPRRMRTGSVALNLEEAVRPIPVNNFTTIRLYEQDDASRDDFFGELRLFNWQDHGLFNEEISHTFHADDDISGDATYTLVYRITEQVDG